MFRAFEAAPRAPATVIDPVHVDATRQAINEQQTRLVLQHSEIGMVIATAAGLFFAYLGWHGALFDVTQTGAMLWAVCKLVVLVPRLMAARHARAELAKPGSAHLGVDATVPLLLSDAIVWGLGAAGIIIQAGTQWQTAAALMTTFAAIGAFGLQAHLRATAAYCGPILLLVAMALLSRQGFASSVSACAILLALGLMLSTARRSQQFLENFVRLRMKSEHLAEQLATSLALTERLKRAQEQEFDLTSRTDPLTGIGNRKGFSVALDRLVLDCKTPGAHGAIFYIDLDGFKAVNDEAGHAAGDEVLKLAATILRGAVRANDVVARLGGDEFAIVARGLSTARDARNVGGNLLRKLAEIRMPGHERLRIGATIGVCLLPSAGIETADEATRVADDLMLAGKRSKKGTITIAGESHGPL